MARVRTGRPRERLNRPPWRSAKSRTSPQWRVLGAIGPLTRHSSPGRQWCPRTLGLVPLADGRHRLCGVRALMLAVNRAILGEQLGDADNLRTEH
jgi:hypothetical protein